MKLMNADVNKIDFIAIILMLFIWIFFGWNTSNPDMENYKAMYQFIGQYGEYSAVEIGFQFAARMGNYLGLDYYSFLKIFSLIGLLLIHKTVKLYSKNRGVVYLLYIIYPFFLDIVQIRNFMAMAIMIYSIKYLVSNKTLDTVKFILLILLATTFHYAFLFYLTFLLTKIKDIKKLYLTVFSTIGVSLVLINSFPYILQSIIKIDRLAFYLDQSTSLYAILLFIFYFIINLILIYSIYYMIIRSLKQNCNLSEMTSEMNLQSLFPTLILKINIIILLSYILITLDVDFVRIFRNIFLLNYILFSLIYPRKLITKNMIIDFKKTSYIIFIILSSIAFIALYTFDTVILEILKNNNFLGS